MVLDTIDTAYGRAQAAAIQYLDGQTTISEPEIFELKQLVVGYYSEQQSNAMREFRERFLTK